jgi:hypothetical protein
LYSDAASQTKHQNAEYWVIGPDLKLFISAMELAARSLKELSLLDCAG